MQSYHSWLSLKLWELHKLHTTRFIIISRGLLKVYKFPLFRQHKSHTESWALAWHNISNNVKRFAEDFLKCCTSFISSPTSSCTLADVLSQTVYNGQTHSHTHIARPTRYPHYRGHSWWITGSAPEWTNKDFCWCLKPSHFLPASLLLWSSG